MLGPALPTAHARGRFRRADLLVGRLGLPYSRVDLALDTFTNPFPLVWVLEKTLAYARQTGPSADQAKKTAAKFAPFVLAAYFWEVEKLGLAVAVKQRENLRKMIAKIK